jgi:sugar lactone lactonase YvrE
MLSITNSNLKYRASQRLAMAVMCAVLAACGGGGDVPTKAAAGQGNLPAPVVSGVLSGEPVTDATFNAPKGLARHSDGSLYVVDSGNATIRKITTDGFVITLAGTAGSAGSADGVGAAARFRSPSNVAVDAAGNVYVADTGNHTIRKITPAGVVSTLAGTAGVSGNADGAGGAAQFNQPWGIAVDAAGNVYVADTQNYLIRKITPQGVVTTHAGTRGQRGAADGDRAVASLLGPRGLTIDAAGDLYLTDWYGPPAPMLSQTSTLVRKVTQAGAITTIAGNIGNGPTEPAFRDTHTITVDGAGNTYVAAQDAIRKITPAGAVSVVAQGTQFVSLLGLAVDGSGNLYAADESRNYIARVTQGGVATVYAGKPTP